MKKAFKSLALLATSALVASSASAAFTANTGDLILGFMSSSGTGANVNVEVDLGYISTFTTASGTLNLGNINGLLSSTYGSNWNTNANVTFGLLAGSSNITTALNNGLGGTFALNTSWVSKASSSLGNSGDFTGLKAKTGVTQTSAASTARNVAKTADQVYNGLNSVGNADAGDSRVAVMTGDSSGFVNGSGFVSFQGALINAQTFTGTDLFGLNVTPANSAAQLPMLTSGSSLYFDQSVLGANNYVDLRQLDYTTNTSTYIGTLNVDSSGNLIFTSASAVPEPSTYGLLGAGALAGVAAVRRRRKAAKVA